MVGGFRSPARSPLASQLARLAVVPPIVRVRKTQRPFPRWMDAAATALRSVRPSLRPSGLP